MYNTTGIKYLGSKASFLDIISSAIDLVADERPISVLDMFSGSTRVAQMARQRGFLVVTSDVLPACEAYSAAFIQSNIENRTTLEKIARELQNVNSQVGWLTSNYGEVDPAAPGRTDKKINAFTRENAMKADGIREFIEEIRDIIPIQWYYTLITSLILAMNEVQNSQGHQRAWFRDFQKSALKPIEVILPSPTGDPKLNISGMSNSDFLALYPPGYHFSGDVLTDEYKSYVTRVVDGSANVIAYIDPPYTTNLDYNQFYHLWDSVVLWDKPTTIGATNRRADRDTRREGGAAHSSLFAKRKHAEECFTRLFTQTSTFADSVIVSYSSDSIVSYENICDMLEKSGFALLDVHDRTYNRHALSVSGTINQETKETAKKHNTEWTFCAVKK